MPFPTKYREPEVRSLIKKADLQGILASEDYGWVRSYREAGIFVEVTAGKRKDMVLQRQSQKEISQR